MNGQPKRKTQTAVVRPSGRRKQAQARRTLRRRFQSRIAIARPRLLIGRAKQFRWSGLGLLAACAALLYWFTMDDMFYVSRIVVDGNRLTPTAAIANAAGVRNYSVFFVQFGDVERRVRDVAGVRDADAWLEWPNIVHIAVSERTPVLAWDDGRRTAWADERGALFALGAAPADLIVVRDLDARTRTRIEPAVIAAVKQIGTTLPAVKRMEYADTRGLNFTDEHGWKIMFGDPEQINAKLAMLQSLTAYLVAQKIEPEYVDVRLPDRAYFKPR
jgi:cell division septal protein FtsQ